MGTPDKETVPTKHGYTSLEIPHILEQKPLQNNSAIFLIHSVWLLAIHNRSGLGVHTQQGGLRPLKQQDWTTAKIESNQKGAATQHGCPDFIRVGLEVFVIEWLGMITRL